MHEPADDLVIRRLHELSGGWPLMVQTLWNDWRNSAQKNNGGGSRRPVLAGDGFAEPWRFTPYGLTATAHVERLLDDLLAAYPDVLEMLAVLLEEAEDPRAMLRYILSVATLEGQSFTGMAVARACDLPWEDGLEEVFDALEDAGLLVYVAESYLQVPTSHGSRELYCYRFALPIWWHLFHIDPNFTDEERRDAARELAQALEECYGSLAWRKVAQITSLWEQAGEFERVHVQRCYLDQLAYIGRLRIGAELAEQSAQRTGAWLDAHNVWLDLAKEMRGYLDDTETFAVFEHARALAERGRAPVAVAETLAFVANWSNLKQAATRSAQAVRKGLEILEERHDAEAKRVKGYLLRELGIVHQLRHEFGDALRSLEQAWMLIEAHDDRTQQSITLHSLGMLHHMRHELDDALHYLEQARVLAEADSTSEYYARTLYELGRLHRTRHELEAELNYLQQVLLLQGSDQEVLSYTLYRLAAIYLDRGECQVALEYIRRGLIIRHVNNLDVTNEEELERRILEECQPSFED